MKTAKLLFHLFGLALLAFALFFAAHTVKRHFDEEEGH